MLPGILVFVLGVLLMILVHELGHFIAAKRFGIKVEEFFLGFGPRLWSVRRGETVYGMKAIPVGGYVRIAGMNPFQEPAPEDRGRLFGDKPAWQRAVVLVAGAATHFVLAFLLLAVFFLFVGFPRARIAEVETTLDGNPSPAFVSGLRSGDEVLAVDGDDVTYPEFLDEVSESPGQPLTLRVRRNGEERSVETVPALSGGEGRLGVLVGQGSRLREDPIEAVVQGAEGVGGLVIGSFRAMAQVFGPEGLARVGQLLSGEERTVDDPVGLVGAARVSGQAAAAGLADVFFFLFAGFNVFVGILNILPLPPLDGGHLAVLGFESVTGRRVDPRRLVPLTAVVAGFLILFTLALTYLDVFSPIPNPFR
jgi:membrane-associated protease RseP (regulator of RpoE activity)